MPQLKPARSCCAPSFPELWGAGSASCQLARSQHQDLPKHISMEVLLVFFFRAKNMKRCGKNSYQLTGWGPAQWQDPQMSPHTTNTPSTSAQQTHTPSYHITIRMNRHLCDAHPSHGEQGNGPSFGGFDSLYGVLHKQLPTEHCYMTVR